MGLNRSRFNRTNDRPVTLFEFECEECETVYDPIDFFDNEEFFRLALHSAVNARDIAECLRIVRASLSSWKNERVAKQIAKMIGIKFVDTRQVLECISRNYQREMIESLAHSEASQRYGWFWPVEE